MILGVTKRLGLAFALIVASMSATAADEPWEKCNQTANMEQRIAGCTAVLARSAKETKQNLATAFYNRGLAHVNKGDYDRAIPDFDEAIKLNPKEALTFNSRGFAFANKGDHDRA